MHGSYCVDLLCSMCVFLFDEAAPNYNLKINRRQSAPKRKYGTGGALNCNLRGMSAVNTASSSPFRTFALVRISSGRVSEKGETRNAAENDRSVVSPSA